MSPTTRTLAWVAVLGVLLGMALGCLLVSCTHHDSGEVVASPSVDSSRVVVVRDSLALERTAHASDLDSLRALLDRSPDTVWRVARRLVHDTVGTGRVDTLHLVRELVVDDSTCRIERDSLAGDVLLWRARDAAHAEALGLCRSRPEALGDTNPPSRATWAAVGAAGALVGVTAILLLAR